MHRGYLKLFRKLVDWEWYTDIPAKTLFIHCLLNANYKDKLWKGVEVNRGQLLCGRNGLAKNTGLSPQQIRTAIKKLKKTGEISTTKSTNGCTLITVCNYESYNTDQPSEQPATQPRSNQGATTTNKEKKEKNKIPKEFFEVFPSELTNDDEFIESWEDFQKVRDKKKCATSERAYKTLLKDLMEFSNGDINKAIKIVDNSSNSGWPNIYKLKDN